VFAVVYEFLKKSFPYPYGPEAERVQSSLSTPLQISKTASFMHPQVDDITRLRARNGLKILLGTCLACPSPSRSNCHHLVRLLTTIYLNFFFVR
jgi:hypothetical protein